MSIHMEKCPRSVHRGFKTATSSWSHSTVVLVFTVNEHRSICIAVLNRQAGYAPGSKMYEKATPDAIGFNTERNHEDSIIVSK